MLSLKNKLQIFVLSVVTIFSLTPALVSASCDNPQTTEEEIRCGANHAAGQTDPNASPSGDINQTVKTVINLLSVAIGIVAVVMIIIGGFRYITSGGAAEKISTAKNTLLYAAIGLIIVALAQVIVRFVLHSATDTSSSSSKSSSSTAPGNSSCPNGQPIC